MNITVEIGESLAVIERRVILATMEEFRNHSPGEAKTRAARALGISLKTLYNRLQEYHGIKRA